MYLIEEKSTAKHLPVHSGFYKTRIPFHRPFIQDVNIEFRSNVRNISGEIKHSNSDFSKALYSVALALLIANFVEHSITNNIEYKINHQLNNLFR
jgi:hypothetical protein